MNPHTLDPDYLAVLMAAGVAFGLASFAAWQVCALVLDGLAWATRRVFVRRNRAEGVRGASL